MKSFEKLIKTDVLCQIENSLDPLQFAYRAKRGVEDTTLTLLNFLYKHQEGPKTHARLLFIDLSSAFNTIPASHASREAPLPLQAGREHCGLDSGLPYRPVPTSGVMSKQLCSSTEFPQGCVLSPLLYILHTNDCRCEYENRHIIKFADDSV